MSLATIQTALQGRLATATGFSAAQVTVNDHRVLATGQNAIVITMDSAALEQATLRQVWHVWQINVELYTRWPGENVNAQANNVTAFENVLVAAEAWPGLNATSGVIVSEITNISAPEQLSIGRTAYLKRVLHCRVKEMTAPSRSEA